MARKSKKVDFVNKKKSKMNDTSKPVATENNIWKAALYARLSSESEADRERETIETQIELMRRYVRDDGSIKAVKEYKDISYTGRNFDRPGFEKMMDDVASGLIDCIIVKDLSRLGRNYLEVGNYLEKIFPFLGVRFIAVTDHYDSFKGGEDLTVPLKNILNEMYTRDISKKISSAIHAKWDAGEFCAGKIPYGYLRIGNRLEPDPVTRTVVEDIFHMFLQGCSQKEIARRLSGKIPSPQAYKSKHADSSKTEMKKWNSTTIGRILRDEVYLGNTVHNRTILVSGRIENVPRKDWIIINGTHAPLIDKESFMRTQELLNEVIKEYRRSHNRNSFDHKKFNLLRHKLFCADCGREMSLRMEGVKHDKGVYRCGRYYNSTSDCSSHKILQKDIHAAVFQLIRGHMRAFTEEKRISHLLVESDEELNKKRIYEQEINKINLMIQNTVEEKNKVFEDYRNGFIDDELYRMVTEKLNNKRKSLERELTEHQNTVEVILKNNRRREEWITLVNRYLRKQKLTQEMVDAFVDKVLVYEGGKIEVSLKYEDLFLPYLSLGESGDDMGTQRREDGLIAR